MNTITTVFGLRWARGMRIECPETSVGWIRVLLYGICSGDFNKHNYGSTAYFRKPVVQGELLAGLFGKFHKKICRLTGRDPILCSTTDNRVYRGVAIHQPFTPSLTVQSVKVQNDIVYVEWLYEITCDNTCHFKKTILYCYRPL